MRHLIFSLSLILSACGGSAPTAPPPAPAAPMLAVAPAAPTSWAGPVTVRFISYYSSPVVSVDIGGLTGGPLAPATGAVLGELPAVGAYTATVAFADGTQVTAVLGLWSPSALVVAFP